MPPKISQKIAEAQLASLQQLVAAFSYRGKVHPSKALQQVVLQAEAAYYERRDFDSVEHLSQVAACIVARERPIFKSDPKKWIEKIKTLRETILIHEHEESVA
jgi:hypothetical protein